MSNFIVRKVAVLGAGVMGAQIAAHCVNAGVPVVLFDLPAKDGDKSAVAQKAIENLRKLSPAPLASLELADCIVPANYDDDLELLGECDLIIEAIAERMDWKHGLYARVAGAIGPNTIFATNTSGLSIAELAQGVGNELQSRFCGVHFFNPPRYMHLVELIPTGRTDPAILDKLEGFLTSTLGKGVVRAKDTPNFVGNRVGMFGILSAMIESERYGLSFDVVDDLTGAKLGRAKSGTYRTGDVVGLDTLGHVIKTMEDHLPDDAFAPTYATPKVLADLIAQGSLGQKSGAGYFRRDGRAILRLDPATGQYVPADGKADDEVARILKLRDPGERLQQLRASTHPHARFVWAILRDIFHYSAVHLQEIAETARDVDFALRWGFGHSTGPFELWQSAGWLQVAEWVKEDIAKGDALADAPLPEWVTSGPVAEHGGVHTSEGSWSPATNRFEPRSALAVYQRQLFRAPLFGEDTVTESVGKTIFEDESVKLWTVARPGCDDVLIASLKTKTHAIGPGVIAGLLKAVDLAEADYRGLVLWNPAEPFSSGVDLQAMVPQFMSGGVQAIDQELQRLQRLTLRLRYAQVPVVAAIAGQAVGAGCQLAIACARRVALLESSMGLNEVQLGLIPAAGGLAAAARRTAEIGRRAGDASLLPFVTAPLHQVLRGDVSRSAREARTMGYLVESDPIVFHAHELLFVAVREVCALSEAGWRPPLATSFAVAGRDAAATLKASLQAQHESGKLSEHDLHLGTVIADVLTGGDVDEGTTVGEPWILEQERQAFLSLLGHPKTQERMTAMLHTGKPVRN